MTSTVETSYKKCFIHVKIELTIVLFSFWFTVFHRQFLISYIFSASLRFGASHITRQWGELRIKNATLHFHILFWDIFLFFIIKFVLLLFSFVS